MYVYSPMSALPRWWCESNWASPLRCSRRRDASPWHSRHPSSPPQLGTIWMRWSAPRAPRCHPEVCRSTTNIWTLSQKIFGVFSCCGYLTCVHFTLQKTSTDHPIGDGTAIHGRAGTLVPFDERNVGFLQRWRDDSWRQHESMQFEAWETPCMSVFLTST